MKSRDSKLIPSIVDVVTAGTFAVAQLKLVKDGYDPNAVAFISSSAQALVVRMAEWFSDKNNIATFRQHRDAEFFAEVNQHIANLYLLVDRTKQNHPTIEEAIALIEQYRDHAARSAQQEKRKLLAAAAAATFRPDVVMEMKSRAERAMATLEPSDIEALRSLSKSMCTDGWEKSEADVHPSQLFELVQTRRVNDGRKLFDALPLTNRIALEQSGCVITTKEVEASKWGSDRPRMIHTPVITPLGETVLTLVETYKRDESGQAEQAGGAG